MSNHTPGPWSCFPNTQHEYLIGPGRGSELPRFCVASSLKTKEMSDQEHDANARAIACVPEMIHALRQAEDGLCSAISTWKVENGDIACVVGSLRSVRKAMENAGVKS